jgi:hypothetical protein
MHALHPDFAIQLSELMEMTDRDGYVRPKSDEPTIQPLLVSPAAEPGQTG